MMKRLVTCGLLAVWTAITVWAAPAMREPFLATQPDGTTVEIMLHGDEHAAWSTTADGVLVVEQNKAFYVAAIDASGKLTATSLLAHRPAERSTLEQQACASQQVRSALFFDQCEQKMLHARRAQVTSTEFFPHEGSPKCLVILANFSDVKFTDVTLAKTQFDQYFNGDTQEDLGHNEQNNVLSVRKYYEQSSQGKFTPEFTVVGPVDLPQTMEFYGHNTGDPGTDANFSQFCKDAIAAVAEQQPQVSFKDFDNSGDGKVELVCIIYAGYGENVSGNGAEKIWPKCGYRGYDAPDGVKVSYFNCGPELYRLSKGTDINGIGLFCHEFSHALGLPDLYPTNINARINNQTPEFWSLMDYGEYASNGYCPVPFSAWEQQAMGWITLEELTASQYVNDVKSVIRGGKAYKFSESSNEEEYFIVENMQPSDRDKHLLGSYTGHGLLVWHIAYNKSTVSMGDNPNNTPGVPRVCIVPADGLVINGYQFGTGKPYTQKDYVASLQGDPFPYSYTDSESSQTVIVNTLTAEQQLPNYIYYNNLADTEDNATPVCKLLHITEDADAGTVSFGFDDGSGLPDPDPTGIRTAVSPAASAGQFFDMQGRRLQSIPVHHGIYITQGRKVVR